LGLNLFAADTIVTNSISFYHYDNPPQGEKPIFHPKKYDFFPFFSFFIGKKVKKID